MSFPEQAESLTQRSVLAAKDHNGLFPRVLRSSFWMLNSNLFSRVLNLMRGIILARLLVPDDFGLFGLASVVIGFTAMFSDAGVGAFLVYCQDRVEEHVDTAFGANLGVATLLAGCALATAPYVARFYQRPDLVPILAVSAVSLWLQTATTVHRNLVRRDLRFRPIATVDASIALTTFLIAVALAWRGFGVWSFVLSTLLGNMVSVPLLFYIYPWVPRWRFSAVSFRALAPFSGWYVAQAVVWYLVLNVDNLMVGKFLGIKALGIYGLAFNYSLLPISLFAITLGNVVYAELPRLYSDPPQFWSAFFTSNRLLAGLVCPLAAVLVVAAPDVIPMLFGPKWASAIVPFQILAVYGAVRGLWLDPLSALGRFDRSFWLAVGTLCASAIAIRVTIRYGTPGVAWAMVATEFIAQIASFWMATRSWRRVGQGLATSLPYFTVAGGAALFAWATRHAAHMLIGDHRFILAGISISTVAVIYALIFWKHLLTLRSSFTNRTEKVPGSAS